jgi:nucleoside-diphosphate-sugar epimerase
MKKYLVTGGTGFIGSALVKKLIGEGHFVRVLDNNLRGSSQKLNHLIGPMLEIHSGDIRKYSDVLKAADGMDSIIHLAYLNGTENFYKHPDLVLDIGVKGMMNVIDVCKELEIKELVLASSSEVYQTPPIVPTDETVPLVIPDIHNPRYSYGGGKIICELMAINYGRKYFDKVIIIRPHNVIGPDMGTEHVIPQFALRMKELSINNPVGALPFSIQGTGNETRAFIYIDDFIEGFYLAMSKGEHLNIYHIGTEEERSIKDCVQEVASVFDRTIDIHYSELQQGSTLRRCPDTTKLKKLGFYPQITFSESIQRTASWYKENNVSKSCI